MIDNNKPFTATNWSEPEDDFSTMFYDQYTSQVWFPEEIPLTNDAVAWEHLLPEERKVYSLASAGLNVLDTLQGEVGMPVLRQHTPGHIRKATLQFQGTMEDIHAKSYSWMNKAFLSMSDERATFQWIETQPNLQKKLKLIEEVYLDADVSDMGLWKKYVVSCMLETALFYSGFFYPLYLAGLGKMVNAGEIFNLIIRDEAVHGVYISMLANEVFERLSPESQEEAVEWFKDIAQRLYRNEVEYSEHLYEPLGDLVHEVKKFIRFNFNVLSDNLNMERLFEEEEVLASVKNGLSTTTKTHDFFSQKGSGYQKIKVESLKDSDFDGIF